MRMRRCDRQMSIVSWLGACCSSSNSSSVPLPVNPLPSQNHTLRQSQSATRAAHQRQINDDDTCWTSSRNNNNLKETETEWQPVERRGWQGGRGVGRERESWLEATMKAFKHLEAITTAMKHWMGMRMSLREWQHSAPADREREKERGGGEGIQEGQSHTCVQLPSLIGPAPKTNLCAFFQGSGLLT